MPASIQIRLMTEGDLPFGMWLKSANGWNQTEADWRRYLTLQPDGCFVAQYDGQPVGTLTTCIFGPVAWIAMVLVDAAYRGRSIGKALMLHALEFLESHEVRTVRLDATPLGRPLYEKLGFVAEYDLHRYEGILTPAASNGKIEPMHPGDLDEIIRLDRSATQTDRTRLWQQLAREFPDRIRVSGHSNLLQGVLADLPGARASQIGPCIALGNAWAFLLDEARSRLSGQPVFIDIAADNHAAAKWAVEAGLTVQRPLLRMTRGPMLPEQRNMICASYGPEMG